MAASRGPRRARARTGPAWRPGRGRCPRRGGGSRRPGGRPRCAPRPRGRAGRGRLARAAHRRCRSSDRACACRRSRPRSCGRHRTNVVLAAARRSPGRPRARDHEPLRAGCRGQVGGRRSRVGALAYPYEAALALIETNDEESLRRALTTLQELGALPAAQLATRRLRALGAKGVTRGPRRATRANAAGLTPREIRGARAPRRGPPQRGDRAAALPLAPNRRPSRVGAPAQARRRLPRRGGRRPRSASVCSRQLQDR